MAESTAEGWFFTRDREKQGPVSFARLQQMAKSGWLTADDLVWHPALPKWTPASEVPGLHGSRLAQVLKTAIPGVKVPASEPSPQAAPKQPAVAQPRKREARRESANLGDAFESLKLRHLIAGCGGLLAALGIAFTVIQQSPLAMALTVGGMVIAAACLSVEAGVLLGQAATNASRLWRESAERALRAKEIALEKKRLEVEAARLAEAQRPTAPSPLPAQHAADSGGQVVVINQPPVQRWSPGVAAVLSFFVPGLGQLYKGQILNAIMWFFLVGLGYVALILPGLILHVCCVLGALSGNPWTEGKTTVTRQ